MIWIKWAVLPAAAYLLGSIPFGVVLTRRFAGIDIRREGSRNIGATNVRRLAGSKLAALTLAGDVLKGAVPVYAAIFLSVFDQVAARDAYVSVVALSALLGHLYPVYMKFKGGGKGVATAAGCFLIISPVSVVICVLVFMLMVRWSNRVSAGSLSAAAVLPAAVWAVTGSVIYAGCAVMTAAWIGYRHRDNVRRLINGTEPLFRDKKSR
ncbi:MAG: glycerol-3-phosphate 1-O-acyltransferase PlsY [Desulfobacterales bacterium]|nr:glycerol-3-phosphate 1-O-acyltransferase PlsY [Desulfobacterales bacterium]MDD4072240.1 glycerol-3-phosphate 1-O-acyltransferase PlsY [Desulfobacterales bacterium]MDD4392969.1 glycerol-3-phosphate 1-O-acyltransferase PlsY [Desulfobacterales bacterium]